MSYKSVVDVAPANRAGERKSSRAEVAQARGRGGRGVQRAALTALALGVVMLCVADPAFAQGGIDKVNTLMQNVTNALKAIGVVTATCAILWAAYKMMFKHASFAEIIMIGGGGVLAGAAAEIAGFLLSS